MAHAKRLQIRKRAFNYTAGPMGLTHVTVRVSNPADHSRAWEDLFLVDTGAIDTMVSGAALRSIGLEPEAERSYVLGDGTERKLGICVGRVEYMGEIVGTTLIFGPDDCEPLLGVTALESVGIVVDPTSQQLKRLPAVPLK